MFSQDQITSVSWSRRYGDLAISWTSGAASGTWYQVYVGDRLVSYTKAKSATIPAPSTTERIQVGTVGTGEAQVDFSASLPAYPKRVVTLSWQGGNNLDARGTRDVAGFKVFAAASPAGYGTGDYGAGGYGTGNPTISIAPAKIVPTFSGNSATDGYGMGGYGSGGYGAAAGSYSWTSDALESGRWGFSVAAYDRAGNLGTVSTGYVEISVPPPPPAADSSGSRLSYTLVGYGVGPYGGGGYAAQEYGSGPYGGGVGYGESEANLTWNPAA